MLKRGAAHCMHAARQVAASQLTVEPCSVSAAIRPALAGCIWPRVQNIGYYFIQMAWLVDIRHKPDCPQATLFSIVGESQYLMLGCRFIASAISRSAVPSGTL